MATIEDPIRADVESCLHAVVEATLTAPGVVVGRARRCVTHRAVAFGERLLQPARLVKSLVDLAAGSSTPMSSAIGVSGDQPAHSELARSRPPSDAEGPTARTDASDASIELPIEEYESLAASQVVARLPSLTADELADVRRFETAHRGRRTVLGKIDQLLLVST